VEGSSGLGFQSRLRDLQNVGLLGHTVLGILTRNGLDGTLLLVSDVMGAAALIEVIFRPQEVPTHPGCTPTAA
jgi:hypothetical protein